MKQREQQGTQENIEEIVVQEPRQPNNEPKLQIEPGKYKRMIVALVLCIILLIGSVTVNIVQALQPGSKIVKSQIDGNDIDRRVGNANMEHDCKETVTTEIITLNGTIVEFNLTELTQCHNDTHQQNKRLLTPDEPQIFMDIINGVFIEISVSKIESNFEGSSVYCLMILILLLMQ